MRTPRTPSFARLLSLLLLGIPGCLLAADTPVLLDACVNGSLESELGSALVHGQVADSEDTYLCSGADGTARVGRNDLVYEWTAPLAGTYRFRVDSDGGSPAIGLAEPVCGGSTFVCERADYPFVKLERDFEAGQTVAIVLEDDGYTSFAPRTDTSANLVLAIELLDDEPTPATGADEPLPTTCPFTDDDVCDEPSGSGACRAGTDVDDCSCSWENDGYCDVPILCAEGTDVADCS